MTISSEDVSRPVAHSLKSWREVFEELVELVPDREASKDGVVDKGGAEVCEGAGAVQSGVLGEGVHCTVGQLDMANM